MKAAIFNKPSDITVNEVPDPKLIDPTDAIVRVTMSCICGSDLWYWRGLTDKKAGNRIGHEFVGIVEEVGADVSKVKPGDFVIAPFKWQDGTCPECKVGMSADCRHGGAWGVPDVDGGQGQMVRVPLADGTLFPVPKEQATEELLPSLLTLSDVMCTGHHAAVCARVQPGSTVVVIGDGAVGLCGVISSKLLGAKRIILMSSHADRQELGKEFGATDIVEARGMEAAKIIQDMTDGLGADAVLECVGTGSAWETALAVVRPGGGMGYVGVPHDVADLTAKQLFSLNASVWGGIAPAASYIPELLPEVLSGKINPGKVFTKTVDLENIVDGYKAMDERKAIKVLVKP